MSAGTARVIASRDGAAIEQAALEVRDVSLVFNTGAGPRPVLDRISFDVFSGEILCLVGPSGCGKTTAPRASVPSSFRTIRMLSCRGGRSPAISH
jgi:NitT/TauT family transport system ATP-binding protein